MTHHIPKWFPQNLFMHRLDPIYDRQLSTKLLSPTKLLSSKTGEIVDPFGPWLTWSGSFTDKCNEVVLNLLKRFKVINNEHVPFTGFAGDVGKLVVVNVSHANYKDTEPCKAVVMERITYPFLCPLLFQQFKIKSFQKWCCIFSVDAASPFSWHKLSLINMYFSQVFLCSGLENSTNWVS